MESPDLPALQNENAQLRTQTALLRMLETLMRDIVPTANIWHREDPADIHSLRLVYTHRSAEIASLPYVLTIGGRIGDLLPELPSQTYERYAKVLQDGKPLTVREMELILPDGTTAIVSLRAIRLAPDYLAVIHEDITDRKRAEVAQQQVREQQSIIQSQQESLLELSTPLIPITDQVMVMPLIGAIDSRRAQQVMQTLLEGIATHRVTVAILDITGVPIVDTQVANALIQAAQSVKLLGAQVVLTGIRPEVAQTLVGLGVDLSGMLTMSNLQAGIAYATRVS